MAKVSRSEPITADEYGFSKQCSSRTREDHDAFPLDDAFLPLHRLGRSATHTRDAAAFFVDLGKVYQQEIAELAAAGCKYVQLDEVAIAILCDPAAREKVKKAGGNPDQLVDLYIEGINQAVKKQAGRRDGRRARLPRQL